MHKGDNMSKIVFESGVYRILEILDEFANIDDLKGDCYNPEVNSDISPELLEEQEREFEQKCYDEGVFGYILEKWNPEVGQGWEHVDSCFGFIGNYENEGHYIVDELASATYVNKVG